MGHVNRNICYAAVAFTALITALIVYYNDGLKKAIVYVGAPKNTQLPHQKGCLEDLSENVKLPSRKDSLEDLSKIVQDQLTQLQNPNSPRNCSVPTIYCGYTSECGLGCQIQQRIACLMVSYGYNMPLIHDEHTGWPYSKRWSQVFYPLGSPCTPGLLTRYVQYKYPFRLNVSRGSTQPFQFYLPNGIPVPKSIADKVELLLPDPYYWWAGQFFKYGLRLLPAEEKLVKRAQNSMNFTHPIVGIHVRRTDKLKEQLNVFHKVEDYFDVANQYFHNLTLKGVSYDVKRVFVASDDPNVLVEATKKFHRPEWEVIGFFNNTRNLTSQSQRKEVLDEMVIDLFTLANCDFVVCTHSSNVCRIVLGLLSARSTDGPQRVKSLDLNYLHQLPNYIIPLKIEEI